MKRTLLTISSLLIVLLACGPDRYEFRIPVEHEVIVPMEVSFTPFVYLSDTVSLDSLQVLMDINTLSYEEIDRVTLDSIRVSVISPDTTLFGFKEYQVSWVSLKDPERQMLIGYLYNPPFVEGPGIGSGVIDSIDSTLVLQPNVTDVTDWILNDTFQTRFSTLRNVMPWDSKDDYTLKVYYQLFVEASK